MVALAKDQNLIIQKTQTPGFRLTNGAVLHVSAGGGFQMLDADAQRRVQQERKTEEKSPPVLPRRENELEKGEVVRIPKGLEGLKGVGGKNFNRREVLKTLGLGGLASVFGGERAKGIVMDPGTPDSEYLALGAECALKPGRPLYIVGFDQNLGKSNFATAAFLNDRFAISAGHVFSVFDPADPRTKFYTGTDLYANAGLLIRPIRKYIFPGYTLGNHNPPDIALMEFAEPVTAFQNAVLGTGLVEGETLTGAGYGIAAVPGVQLPDSEQYKLRAYTAPAEDFRPSWYHPDAYFSSYFEAGHYMEGRGNPGDSGAPVYNQAGHLIGITSGGTGGANAPAGGGHTIFARLDYSEIRSWINDIARTGPQLPPEDPTMTFAVEGSDFCIKVPWTSARQASGRWQVQASTDLHAWGAPVDFVQEGAFGVFRSPLGQREYFRLKWLGD